MKLMHTKLPEFIRKMQQAVGLAKPEKTIEIRGLENLKSAKLQSLRTGRIEEAVAELAGRCGMAFAWDTKKLYPYGMLVLWD